MKIKLLVLIFSICCSFIANSQSKSDTCKIDYLAFETGMVMDGYNSLGIRTFFEYQRDVRKNWQWAISYEHSRHLGFVATDQMYELETNLSLLCANWYYKLNLLKNRIFWNIGLGVGIVHADWEQIYRSGTYSDLEHHNSIGATVNASITLNIRITRRIYFESSPLILFLPSDRVYYSPMNAGHFSSFYAYTFFPFGIKVKL